MTELKRNSDVEIHRLIDRVEHLEGEVKKLRDDFEMHEEDQNTKLALLQTSLVSIQVKLDQLIIDIREPVEAYKTAKAGMTFLKFLTETAKWVVPLVVGLYIGYGGVFNKTETSNTPTALEQKQK